MRKLCIMLLNNQYIREEKKFLKMKHCLIQKKKRKITLLNQRYIINSCKQQQQKSLHLNRTVRRVKRNPVKEFKFSSKKSEENKKKEEEDTINQCRK